MAEIFKNGIVRRSESLVTFLVVGPSELCHRISEGLLQSAKERRWVISVHKCESIGDVVKARLNISVDFIILAFDSRAAHTLLEVEDNITKIDEHYVISGAICLVNCIGMSHIIGMIRKSKELCCKYNIRFLSANVFNVQDSVYLGSRILNVTEGLLGLSSGIPIIETVVEYN